jgi:hypothetical protein
MSIQKAIKSKNSGDFIEHIQAEVLRNGFSEDVTKALLFPPKMSWGAFTEMQRQGLLAWNVGGVTDELIEHLKACTDDEEFRSAIIGALFMFGVGAKEYAIEHSEFIFGLAEKSNDYEFFASTLISELVRGGVDWHGSEEGIYYVNVDKSYLSSTIQSVSEDFRSSGWLFKESYILDFSTGLAKSDQLDKSLDLLIEFAKTLEDFSSCESLIYSLTTTISGFAASDRSLKVDQIAFANKEICSLIFSRASSLSKKSDKSELEELEAYISENF